jgi:hypothetical protein
MPMPSTSLKSRFLPLQMLALAAVAVLTSFIWQGNKGFSLWDEGFLWYGAQRVMLGEVPFRDFMSYDPGRYYWSAALMGLWGDNGIMALRAAVAIFQAMGLFVGLLLIARVEKTRNWLYWLLSALILMAWMHPRHKLFDISVAIFLIGALTYLVEKPTSARYFLAGLCVGLAAVFGRNHGLYGAVSSLGAIGWLSLKRTEGPGLIRALALWATGVALGYIPIFIMMLTIPGFAVAFWENLRFLFEMKGTNLAVPTPWPWLVDFAGLPIGEAIRSTLIGLFFIGMPAFGVLAVAWAIRQKLRDKPVSPALVAASFLALPYAQFAFSRADISHLAQGIFPLLIGCLALLSSQAARIKWPLALALGTATVWVMYPLQPGWQCYTGQCVDLDISHSKLRVDPGTARDVDLLRKLANTYAPNGRTFIVVPFWPGAYALLERKSPMWEIFPLFPRPQAFEQAEIERIKAAKPGFALVVDQPLDGHDALRFQNTHPLIHQYILDNFDSLPDSPDPSYQIYKAKGLMQ